MLTCDPQLPVFFLQASSFASCFLVFVLFITSVEMLILVFLFTKSRCPESYCDLLRHLHPLQLGVVCRSVRRSTNCSHIQVICEESSVLDQGHIPMEHCLIFS